MLHVFGWALRSSFIFSNLQKSTGQRPQSSKTNSAFCVFGVRERNQNYPSNAANDKNTKLRIHSQTSTILSDSCGHLSVSQSVILNKAESMTTMYENLKAQRNSKQHIQTRKQIQGNSSTLDSSKLALHAISLQAGYMCGCSPKRLQNISFHLRMQQTSHNTMHVTGAKHRKTHMTMS